MPFTSETASDFFAFLLRNGLAIKARTPPHGQRGTWLKCKSLLAWDGYFAHAAIVPIEPLHQA